MRIQSGLFLLAILTACDRAPVTPPPAQKEAPPGFVQKEFAKNPDADCSTHHPIDHYQQLAATPKGLEELAFLKCQLTARGEWHTRRAQELQARGESGTGLGNEIAMGMRCTQESMAVIQAMQKAGVVATNC